MQVGWPGRVACAAVRSLSLSLIDTFYCQDT